MTVTTLVTPERASWIYAGLSVLDLPPGGSADFQTAGTEMLVLPLSAGPTVVECDGVIMELDGRSSVFARVTDFAYLPRDAAVTVRARDGGKYALPNARCERRLDPRYAKAADVPVELRGAGAASRQVNNFCAPDAFETVKLTAVEVLTPGGNWSSYPPHKHDTEAPGEAVLEEIYYFQLRDVVADPTSGGPAGGVAPRDIVGAASSGDVAAATRSGGYAGGAAPRAIVGAPSSGDVAAATRSGGYAGGAAPRGMGYQRVYASPGKPIDVLLEVRSGDVVLVPHGYHGPSMAAPGYDMYYLNVLAGPAAERTMAFRDDPCHAWIRDTWHQQAVDPRLPMTTHLGASGGR